MPLTDKGKRMKRGLTRKYGKEKAGHILYGGENTGNITGIHKQGRNPRSHRKKK